MAKKLRNIPFIVFVTFLLLSTTTNFAQTFVERGNTIEQWDMLDLRGDATILPASDETCPPGYGPDVLHIEGGLVLGMAKNQNLSEGTFVALYRENQPRNKDADGILLVKSEYDQDISVAHNTKEKRPHVWFEQDNDCGVQIRLLNAEEKEENLAEKCGLGVVTDTWNRTNWIWQKVTIEGDVIRAKTWAAHKSEPQEWALETEYKGFGERFGFKINSGNINLAYFAADAKDITVEAPDVFIYSPVLRITKPNKINFILFVNEQLTKQKTFDVEIRSKDKTIGKSKITIEIPVGSSEIPLLLTTGDPASSESGLSVKLQEEPVEGELQIILSDASGNVVSQRKVKVLSTEKIRGRLTKSAKTIKDLNELLTEDKKATEAYKAVKVIHDAAKSHLDNAVALFDAGDLDASDLAFRFVSEALGELTGFKRKLVTELDSNVNLSVTEWDENDKRGVGVPKAGISDAYSMKYQISFGEPIISAQSMVMGNNYSLTIPWYVEGESPDKNYNFEVRMLSPFGNRVVAKSETEPEIPTSKWKPGETYLQHLNLEIIPEDPFQRKVQPKQPAVLDEYHYLLVSVIDSETGAKLILGNLPGPQPERVGQSFLAGDFFISSTSLEIQKFAPLKGEAGKKRKDSFVVANKGEKLINAGALFTVTTATGQQVYQNYKKVEVAAGQQVSVDFEWISQFAGELEVKVDIVKNRVTITEAKKDIYIDMPLGTTIEIAKKNHVIKEAGKFFTPIQIETGQKEAEVFVYADSRLVGTRIGKGQFEVKAEPWFGYYDVVVKVGNYMFIKQVLATVVETSGMDIMVNGEPFLVKGVNVHGLDGQSPEKSRSMMRIMRELGFNAWRGDYPPMWQMELAYELNSVYTVLGPFSCTGTDEIFARQVGPPMATARELSRLLVERYQNTAGVLLWNSCNEIVGENIDFLNTLLPVFESHDLYKRPVHYANLYGQDLYQGQNVMGVNYYFGANQTAKDRQPLIQRSINIARSKKMPVMFNEFNSYAGAIHSTGVEAMYGMYNWGVEQGMSGGFQYMKGNSASHPGIFDEGFNTHKIYNEAIIDVLADAEVTGSNENALEGEVKIQIRNKRRFTLRQVRLTLSASDKEMNPITIADITPKSIQEIAIKLLQPQNNKAVILKGDLEFVSHYGFKSKVPVSLIVQL